MVKNMSDSKTILKRSIYSGQVSKSDIGNEVTLCGWVHRRRDHGGVIFIDLRDRSGLAQIVFDPRHSPTSHQAAEGLRSEHVIGIRGKVRARPEGMRNAKLSSGDVEVLVDELNIFNSSETMPFMIEGDSEINENTRLKYRYLDLRQPALQKNFIIRHRMTSAIRKILDEQGFLDVETPFLTKSTPEGARDYLVPCRMQPSYFYALPQDQDFSKEQIRKLFDAFFFNNQINWIATDPDVTSFYQSLVRDNEALLTETELAQFKGHYNNSI
jgi:aspartyl-tRNA synthetase